MGSLVVSIIALVISAITGTISILLTIKSSKQTKKINDINIKSRYFQKIFDEYLINRLPAARDYIRFDSEGRLVDSQKYVDELTNMRNAAKFFKYDNKSFYDELKKTTQELEDFLMDSGNNVYENDEQSHVHDSIREKTEKIYACINNYYYGM